MLVVVAVTESILYRISGHCVCVCDDQRPAPHDGARRPTLCQSGTGSGDGARTAYRGRHASGAAATIIATAFYRDGGAGAECGDAR